MQQKGIQSMRWQKYKKFGLVLMFAISIIFSWGGILYAVDDPNDFKIIGIIVSFVGYSIFFGAVCIYEGQEE